MKSLIIGGKIAETAVVQGGMGVGVSRCDLAGAVAGQGGVGIISTAQIGYDEPGFETNQAGCNIEAIKKHIVRAKETAAGRGVVGVNVMAALKHYREHVKAAVEAGADVVVCGAGLPLDLPELVAGKAAIAPIVSSKRAAQLLLKRWESRYNTTADMIVVEGPQAGGHLGYSREELLDMDSIDFDTIVKEVIEVKNVYEERFGRKISVVAGGGIYTKEDAEHIRSLGVDGIQVGSRFVTTMECDADIKYKMAYVNAKREDIVIVKSPVGMPGRAVNNEFIKRISAESEKVNKCYMCLEKCNPAKVPYCITKALINAVKGDVDNGLIFCGAKAYKADKIQTVAEVINELV